MENADLVHALPASVTLELYRRPQGDTAAAATMATAFLNHNSTNRQYRREVVQVWAYHQPAVSADATALDYSSCDRRDDADLHRAAHDLRQNVNVDAAIGCVINELASRRLRDMPWVVLPAPTAAECGRLQALLQACAQDCAFDKFGDAYLWNLLRFELHPEAEAALCTETPYQAINARHGAGANELVQGWIRTLPQDLPGRVDHTSSAAQGLVVIAGILQEHLDGIALPVAVNGEAARPSAVPRLAGLQGLPGFPDTCLCVSNGVCQEGSREGTYTSVILQFARELPQQDLFLALTDPAALPASSTLRQYT